VNGSAAATVKASDGTARQKGAAMPVEDQRNLLFSLVVLVEPDGDAFHAYCPALAGLHTSGQTVEEALQNAKDAAVAYSTSPVKHHDPIPVGCLAPELHQRV
jgi:predicted RNase H-like HicB family nuclease